TRPRPCLFAHAARLPLATLLLPALPLRLLRPARLRLHGCSRLVFRLLLDLLLVLVFFLVAVLILGSILRLLALFLLPRFLRLARQLLVLLALLLLQALELLLLARLPRFLIFLRTLRAVIVVAEDALQLRLRLPRGPRHRLGDLAGAHDPVRRID